MHAYFPSWHSMNIQNANMLIVEKDRVRVRRNFHDVLRHEVGNPGKHSRRQDASSNALPICHESLFPGDAELHRSYSLKARRLQFYRVNCRNIPISNNVGTVKHVSSTLL
jgi:hypothetical protein